MNWKVKIGILILSCGFVLSPDWGPFDPSLLGYWLLGIVMGHNIATWRRDG